MDGSKFDDLTQRLASAQSRRQALKLLGAGIMGGAGLTRFRGAEAQDKVTICHFTGSETNPVVVITISVNALPAHQAHGDFVFGDCCLDSECSDLDDQCNVGSCDEGTCVAVPANEGGSCDDDDACTDPDTCTEGVCSGPAVNCDDEDECTEDSCDPATGCVNIPISCDDGDECTEDSCDPATGCVNTPIEDCDGGNEPCVTFECGFGSCASRPTASPPDCFCFELADEPGTGICLGNYPCASAPLCTTDSQCPIGHTCTINTCCGPQGQCAPPCPDPLGITTSLESNEGGPTAGR